MRLENTILVGPVSIVKQHFGTDFYFNLVSFIPGIIMTKRNKIMNPFLNLFKSQVN